MDSAQGNHAFLPWPSQRWKQSRSPSSRECPEESWLSVSGWNLGQSCDLETDYCCGSVLKIDRRLPSARTPLACALRLFLPVCSQLSLLPIVISGGGPHVSRCPGQRLRLTSGEFLSAIFLSLSPGLLLLVLAWMHLSVPSAWLCLPTVGTDESVHSPPTTVATFLSSSRSSAQGGQRGSCQQDLLSLLHLRPSPCPLTSCRPHALCPVGTHCHSAVPHGPAPHLHQVQYQESMPLRP